MLFDVGGLQSWRESRDGGSFRRARRPLGNSTALECRRASSDRNDLWQYPVSIR